MDSDNFADPRNRSKRGGGRGRGRGRDRGTRGRGQGTAATRGRGGAGSKSGKAPAATVKREQRDRLGSNAFRFSDYDEQRAQSRRNGVYTEDFESFGESANRPGGSDDSADDDDADVDLDDTGHKPVDSLGADAPDAAFLRGGGEEDAQDFLQQALRADFSGLADVLSSVPLWARLGSDARFGMHADENVIDDLVGPYEDDEVNDSGSLEINCQIDNDVVDLMRDVDEMGLGKEESTGDGPADAQRTVGVAADADPSGQIDDDDFDRWLDEV